MLSWTKRTDGWYSNGYRITSAGPLEWLLLPNESHNTQGQSVSLVPQPLAVAKTFTECKREAELIDAARTRSEVRRRSSAQLALIAAVSLLLLGMSNALDYFVVVGAIVLSIRPLSGLLGSLWMYPGAADVLMYQ